MDLAINCFLNPSGLSYVGQAFYRLFSSQGFSVVPVWITPPDLESRYAMNEALFDEMVAASSVAIDGCPLQFHAGAANQIKALKQRSALLASVVVEGNRLTEPQTRTLKNADAMLVPSVFCRNACLASGFPKSKVFLVPYPLDHETWNPNVKPLLQNGENFRFLYMNTWYERKGWDVLLRAYWEEFSKNDQVELVIKSYRENDRTEPVEASVAIAASRLGIDRWKRAKITVLDHLVPAKALPGFMKSFDAYVSPHRAEGFGLNIWHAAAIGLPVICTDYGGNTDFTKNDTAWLVRPSEMVRPSQKELDIFPHLAGTTWAEPDVSSLRQQMRLCFANRNESAKRAAIAADFVERTYSCERSLEAFRIALEKTAPGAWHKLCFNKDIERLANQPSERFRTNKEPISMSEI
jgi:glycosyltransferase involved in cell wall biosynthesis